MAEVELTIAGILERQALVVLFRELLEFVLYMHNQIPCTSEQLPNMTADLISDGKQDSIAGELPHRSFRFKRRKASRKANMLLRLQEAIKKFISTAQSAILTLPSISSILLVLGPSTARPRGVYRICIDCKLSEASSPLVEYSDVHELTNMPLRHDRLSRKMVRELLVEGVGGLPSGPTKLFLLVLTSASNLVPQCFLPKRGYVCPCVKVSPVKVTLASKDYIKETKSKDASERALVPEDLIWFQCSYTVKGIASEPSCL